MTLELSVSYDGEEQTLLVEDESIVLFEKGLVGFPQWQRFVLLEDPDAAPVVLLQCLDDIAVSFLVTDPRCVVADYAPRFAPEELERIGLSTADNGRILCILVASTEGAVRLTANLLGPIIINTKTMQARQVVLPDSQYSAQHPVLAADEIDLTDKIPVSVG